MAASMTSDQNPGAPIVKTPRSDYPVSAHIEPFVIVGFYPGGGRYVWSHPTILSAYRSYESFDRAAILCPVNLRNPTGTGYIYDLAVLVSKGNLTTADILRQIS